MALTSEQILDLIEASRIAGHLSNDQARAASMALVLEGHEAMLAARMLGNGGDPASVEYLATGEVSELVARAHLEGPGVYTDPYAQETGHYLLLCSQSEDESAPTPTLRGRITRAVAGAGLISAGQQLGQRLAGAGLISMAADERDLPTVVGLITGEREKIRWLPSATMTIQGVETRLYASDRGFANAYWQGHKHAATFNVDKRGDYVAVGCRKGSSLREVGITADKALSAAYGLIFKPEIVSEARELAAQLRETRP